MNGLSLDTFPSYNFVFNIFPLSRVKILESWPFFHLAFVFFFLQLQSNLIPGLNLNALGLFPSGPQGMGPSMPSVAPPGAYGGSPFGVSPSLILHPLLARKSRPPLGTSPPLLAVLFIYSFWPLEPPEALSSALSSPPPVSLRARGSVWGSCAAAVVGEQPAPRCKSPNPRPVPTN